MLNYDQKEFSLDYKLQDVKNNIFYVDRSVFLQQAICSGILVLLSMLFAASAR